jgi:hypothetical protein
MSTEGKHMSPTPAHQFRHMLHRAARCMTQAGITRRQGLTSQPSATVNISANRWLSCGVMEACTAGARREKHQGVTYVCPASRGGPQPRWIPAGRCGTCCVCGGTQATYAPVMAMHNSIKPQGQPSTLIGVRRVGQTPQTSCPALLANAQPAVGHPRSPCSHSPAPQVDIDVILPNSLHACPILPVSACHSSAHLGTAGGAAVGSQQRQLQWSPWLLCQVAPAAVLLLPPAPIGRTAACATAHPLCWGW